MTTILIVFFVVAILFVKLGGMPGAVVQHEISRFYYNKVKWQNPIKRSDFIKINALLEKFSPYYVVLDENNRARFIHRMLYYVHNWQWEGRHGLEMNLEIQMKVASCATQLTFGLQNFTIDFIERIVVYPDRFYSKLIRHEVKGLTYGFNGLVALSWKDFEEGYRIADDRYNLGLHEMAHALNLSAVKGVATGKSHRAFEIFFWRWRQKSKGELNKIKHGNHIIRAYGGTNEEEFFSVCVEHFFERPEEFQRELPEIYYGLCLVLNQNPLNIKNNYRVIYREVKAKLHEIQESKKAQTVTRAYTARLGINDTLSRIILMGGALSFFSFFVSIHTVFDKMMGNYWLLFAYAYVICFVLYRIAKPMFETEESKSNLQVACAMVLPFFWVQICMFLNTSIPVKTGTESYKVVRFYEQDGELFAIPDMRLYPENFYKINKSELSPFEARFQAETKKQYRVNMVFSTGMLGMRNFERLEVLKEE